MASLCFLHVFTLVTGFVQRSFLQCCVMSGVYLCTSKKSNGHLAFQCENLQFVLSMEKSSTQKLEFLDLVEDSTAMQISLPRVKIKQIQVEVVKFTAINTGISLSLVSISGRAQCGILHNIPCSIVPAKRPAQSPQQKPT